MDYISCGSRQLYRNGGFYEAPALIDQLTEESTPKVRMLTELFPAFSYERKLPEYIDASEEFRQKLLAHYGNINLERKAGAGSSLVELSQVVLAHNVLYVQQEQSRQIVYETYRLPDRPWSPLLESDTPVVEFAVERDTHYFFLGSVGSFNFGHWLLDDLPRLRAVVELRAAYPGHRIVILLPRYGEGMEESLSRRWDEARSFAIARFLGSMRRYAVSFVEVSRAYSFKKLFYATPVSYHPVLKSPESLGWLADRFVHSRLRFRLYRTSSRLLVIRRSMRGRVVQNMDSLRSLLEKRGFKSIDPEEMSVAAQAAAFADADIVVGVMGAAMSSTVFCKPGTRVIHLVPDGWMEPFYWDLAAVQNHIYAVCCGPVLSAGPAHESSFQVPEASLLRVLHALD